VNGLTAVLEQIIVYSTSYTLVALGIIVAGRAGVFNVGGEGIMLASASAGFMAAYFAESWLFGFVVGALFGAALGFLLAAIHEFLKVNQFIVGIFLVIFGAGLSDLMYKVVMGIRLTAPQAPTMPEISIPVLRGVPILRAALNQDPVVYFMYAATFAAWWFFYRTKVGLETRAIGELPQAADVVGVNVRRRRLLWTTIGGALIGVAGAYLPIYVTGTYNPNISGGRGFMAIGIAIFAGWRPNRALLGGLLFAAVEVLSYQLQLATPFIPFQFFMMLPFVAVIVIMVLFRRYIDFPGSIGKPYSRE
jgi:general nucleoside transport system permease protein